MRNQCQPEARLQLVRREGAPDPAPAPCLTPIFDERRRAERALRQVGCTTPAGVLISLAVSAVRRAAALRSEGWPAAQADRMSLHGVDFDDPRVMGPLIVAVPGLHGGRRQIEEQIWRLLLDAIAICRSF